MNRSFKLAFCSIAISLGVVLMLITTIIPIANYSLPAIAGLISAAIVIEFDVKHAVAVFLATSLLAALLVPDKESVALFILFFGHYPIVKSLIEKTKNMFFQLLLKFLIFNVSAVSFFLVSVNLLRIPKESFSLFGIYLPIVFLVLGNIVFLLYDYAVDGLLRIYINQIHPKIKKTMKF